MTETFFLFKQQKEKKNIIFETTYSMLRGNDKFLCREQNLL